MHRPYLAGSGQSLLLGFCLSFPREPDQQGPDMVPGSIQSSLAGKQVWVVFPVASCRVLKAQEERLVLCGESRAFPAFSTTPSFL